VACTDTCARHRDNFTADARRAAFESAVDLARSIRYPFVPCHAPFDMRKFATAYDRRDRAAIGDRVFKDIDVLVLPTTRHGVDRRERDGEAQALSAANTMFANYFGLPPSAFRAASIRAAAGCLQDRRRPSDETTVLRVRASTETTGDATD